MAEKDYWEQVDTLRARIEQGEVFNVGGREVGAVTQYQCGPALIVGEDEEEVGVQYKGEGTGPEHGWHVVLLSDLKQGEVNGNPES